MEKNEIIQWSVVGIIILLALLWAALRILRLNKYKKDTGGCSCCSESASCKLKDLKSEISKTESCHDGQSARN